jgi:signal transduction histidine kinase
MNAFNPLETVGLKFFGQVLASISHEIKNMLAIVNENAGLLEDLTLLAKKGAPLSVERLERISTIIKKQVNRADLTIKKMNRFSHSTDQSLQPVDLSATAAFVVDVCNRLISIRDGNVALAAPGRAVVVESSLFHLEHMIWRCIDFMLNAAENEKNITLTFERSVAGAQIRMTCKGDFKTDAAAVFPSETEKVLQEILQAELDFTPQEKEIRITLPLEIG